MSCEMHANQSISFVRCHEQSLPLERKETPNPEKAMASQTKPFENQSRERDDFLVANRMTCNLLARQDLDNTTK